MKPTLSRKIFFVVLLFIISSSLCAQIYNDSIFDIQKNIIPYPKTENKTDGGYFEIKDDFTIKIEGVLTDKIKTALNRFYQRLGKIPGKKENPDMIIHAEKDEQVKNGMNEFYKLSVLKNEIELSSPTDIGIARGLETLLQMRENIDGKTVVKRRAFEDSPRFPWRGLMIDACRHFMPVDVIKRNLDGMADVKLNVLHWHLSEDQGFRVECKTFPLLHEKGSNGDYYTQEQIKEIIKYANERGIRVVPEFDIPGHSTAWFAGYPEYASAPGPYEIEQHYGVFDPSFNPAKEETYEFFDKFFTEMAGLFNDEYIHIGGDENEGKQWDANSEIQEFKKKNGFKSNHELQGYFNKRIQKILDKNGKKMIGWDEIFSEELPKSIVIHSWRGKDAMTSAAKLGFASILSNGYYIDLCQSVFDHYYNDPLPENIPLDEGSKKYILGGEATMWAELVTPETVDSRIWPRTAAIAEVLWSGIKDFTNDSLENKMILTHRLKHVSKFLEESGLKQNTNREIMISRISDNPGLLRDILGTAEPLKYYNRHKYTKYSQSTQLTRPVDIAVPDAPLSLEFSYLVNRIIKGTAGKEEIEKGRQVFVKLSKDCSVIFNSRLEAKLTETDMLADKVGSLSNIISGLLYCIQNKTRYGEEAINFKYYREPVCELEITLVNSAEELNDFIAGGKHLK